MRPTHTIAECWKTTDGYRFTLKPIARPGKKPVPQVYREFRSAEPMEPGKDVIASPDGHLIVSIPGRGGYRCD